MHQVPRTYIFVLFLISKLNLPPQELIITGWQNIAYLKEKLVHMAKYSEFELEQILTAIHGKFRKKAQ